MTQFAIFTLDQSRHGLPLGAAERVLPMVAVTPLQPVAGIVSLPGGLVLIQDLDAFLSLEDERALAQALTAAQ